MACADSFAEMVRCYREWHGIEEVAFVVGRIAAAAGTVVAAACDSSVVVGGDEVTSAFGWDMPA